MFTLVANLIFLPSTTDHAFKQATTLTFITSLERAAQLAIANVKAKPSFLS